MTKWEVTVSYRASLDDYGMPTASKTVRVRADTATEARLEAISETYRSTAGPVSHVVPHKPRRITP